MCKDQEKVSNALKDRLYTKDTGQLRYWKLLLIISSCCFLFFLAFSMMVYFLSDAMLGHICSNVTSVSFMFTMGFDLYHPLDSGDCYSLLYGPLTTLINFAHIKLTGPSILAVRLPGILAFWGTILAAFWLIKKETNAWIATGTATYGAGIMLFFGRYAFWQRGDPIMALLVGIALLSVGINRKNLAAMICGVTLGLCVNLKITGMLYFIPVYALFFLRHACIHRMAISLAISAVVAVFPFMAFKQISLCLYIDHLRNASRHGFDGELFFDTIRYGLLMTMPLMLMVIYQLVDDPSKLKRIIIENRIFILSLLMTALLLIIPASKKGAGEHHLMPLIPYILFILAKQLHCFFRNQEWTRWQQKAKVALIVLLLCWGCIYGGGGALKFVKRCRSNELLGRNIGEELRHVMADHPNDKIGMGYGSGKTYHWTFYHPLLVRKGHPHRIDAATAMEMRATRFRTPPKMLAILNNREIDLFLIPHDDIPFSMGYLYSLDSLFFDDFREAFFKNYEKRNHTAHFDLWYSKKEKK